MSTAIQMNATATSGRPFYARVAAIGFGSIALAPINTIAFRILKIMAEDVRGWSGRW